MAATAIDASVPARPLDERDLEAERRERELVERYRLRLARTASRIALIVVGAIAVYILVHPTIASAAARPLFWMLLGAAALVSVALHFRSRSGAPAIPLWGFYAWIAAVLAFDTAVVWLDGDPASDIYLVYLLPVLFAAATLPMAGVVLTMGVAVLSYLTILLQLDGAPGEADLILRSAAFAVVGLLGGYLAREQQREIAVQVEQELRTSELLAKVISAQEDERKRIARELHDGPVQELSMVSMQLGHVEEMPAEEFVRSQPRIAELRGALRQTLSEVRRMIQNLRPSALDDLGLVTAMHDFTAAQCAAARVSLRWSVSGHPPQLKPAIETALFRILQEGVYNVVRHAHASAATVVLEFGEGALRAIIADDGIGFDPHAPSHARDGRRVGLLGMRERAALLRGKLEIHSAPDHGTRLVVEVPLDRRTNG